MPDRADIFQMRLGFRLQRPGAPQIGRQDRRGELRPPAFRCPIPHPGRFHRNRANPGLNLPFGQITMPDQPPAANPIGLIGMGGKKRVQLGLNRLRDQFPRTLAQPIRQRVGGKSGRRAKRDTRILHHVAYRSPPTYTSALSDQWRDIAHSLRDLRRVNNALICHPIPPSPTFSDSSASGGAGWPRRV